MTACVSVFTALTSVIHITSVSAADFRHIPLPAEKQGELDALVTLLGSDSAQVREQAGRDIIKFGDSATETLRKALENQDYTISDSAHYYLRLLNQGLLRYGDSEEVRRMLTAYETFPDSRRAEALYSLSHLPPDDALSPLLRIVMSEKNVTLARSAAVAVMWNLPCTRIYPEWPQVIPLPETTPKYPNPERWEEQNLAALAEREKLQAEIRQYLESEPEKTVGKTLLLELFTLEQELREKTEQKEEADLKREKIMVRFMEMNTEYLEEIRKNPLPESMGFLKDFTYFVSDLFYQTKNAELGSQYYHQATIQYHLPLEIGNYVHENGRIVAILGRFQSIQRLAARGHWESAANEIIILKNSMKPFEQARFSTYFVSLLRSIGNYESALKILQASRRYFFLSSDTSKEETDQITAQILYLRLLAACKKSDYKQARELIDEMLEKGEVDIDGLILARRLAQFQKDTEWENTINQRVDKELEKIKEKIENPLRFHNETELITHNCNAFAWLAGNTDRRLDEALEYAERALEERPDTPGVMDTLATVHFARGEKEKAIEIQKEAHRNSPNELDILRNLHRFEVVTEQ
ncbi:MAG: hypothetical protein Q4C70_02485 [Planctomycetia bacterium]|nr:hypothetical protein [Planctomycetia bacterium]